MGRRRIWAGGAVALGLATVAGAVWAQGAGVVRLSNAERMRHVVNPAAELYWKAGGAVDTEEGGADRTPVTPERWAEIVNAAAVLQESGVLLMDDPRAKEPEWAKASAALNAGGAAALAAARAKDGEKVFEAGSALYDSCFSCHAKYIPRPENSLYRQRLPDDAFKPPM